MAIDPIWFMIAGYAGIAVLVALAVVWYAKRK